MNNEYLFQEIKHLFWEVENLFKVALHRRGVVSKACYTDV